MKGGRTSDLTPGVDLVSGKMLVGAILIAGDGLGGEVAGNIELPIALTGDE